MNRLNARLEKLEAQLKKDLVLDVTFADGTQKQFDLFAAIFLHFEQDPYLGTPPPPPSRKIISATWMKSRNGHGGLPEMLERVPGEGVYQN